MNGRIILRIVSAVLLIAVLVGAGALIYNAGVMQGAAVSGQLAAPGSGTPGTVTPNPGSLPYPYYYPHFFRPWGWGFGFFPFGFIFPLFFFLLIFVLIRGIFFRGHGWDHRYYGGWGGPGGPRDFDPNQVPPMVAEWHRKMHESADQTEQNQP